MNLIFCSRPCFLIFNYELYKPSSLTDIVEPLNYEQTRKLTDKADLSV